MASTSEKDHSSVTETFGIAIFLKLRLVFVEYGCSWPTKSISSLLKAGKGAAYYEFLIAVTAQLILITNSGTGA